MIRLIVNLHIIICVYAGPLYAAFATSFQPRDPSFGNDTYADTRCNLPELGPNVGCSGSWSNAGDNTPFLQELYTDSATGFSMYHVIIGRPQDGFSQEFYIRANGPAFEGAPGSASLGAGSCRSGFNYIFNLCNISDPLGITHDNVFTGNGTGNPKAIVIRELHGGTWDNTTKTWSCSSANEICYEFVKEDLQSKPNFSLRINDSAQGMTSNFSFDMRNSNYDTDTTAGVMQNSVTISQPGLAGADFIFATDADPTKTHVTGGRYKFTGTGPTNVNPNPYLYWEGNFVLDQVWWRYKNN